MERCCHYFKYRLLQSRLQQAQFTDDDFRAISTAATAKQCRCSKVGDTMKYRLLISLIAFAPTLVLAQTGLPSGVNHTEKPAGMLPAPTPQTVQNTVKAVETVSGATSMMPNNSVTPSSVKSSGKDVGATMKSTYVVDYCTINGVTDIC